MIKMIDGIVKDLKSAFGKFRTKMENIDKKKFFLMNFPYILTWYFCDKIAWLWRVSSGQDVSEKMMAVIMGLEDLFSYPLPSLHPKDLFVGAGCGIALYFAVYIKTKNAKKFRHGMEYGSARWSA